MLQFLAKSGIDSTVSVPQSNLSILAKGKTEILQYDIFTGRAVSLRVRCAIAELYERCTEPGNGQCPETSSLFWSGRSVGLCLLAGLAYIL